MDDKRRLCRTQGKFSSKFEANKDSFKGGTSSPSSQRHAKRENTRNQLRHEKKSLKNNTNCEAYEQESAYKYQEPSFHEVSHLQQNDESYLPKTIDEPGKHIISETENGHSILHYILKFIDSEKGYHLMKTLRVETDWLDKNVIINGQEYPQPRLVAWYGPFPYKYAGVTLKPKEFSATILEIKRNVEETLKKKNININLNSVLLNLYRDGKDSVAWHSDDEISMGIDPTIASVSLGDTRRFELRRKPSDTNHKPVTEYVVHLDHGSLVVMDGVMQQDWQHRVPKEYHDRNERINLTFRTVFPNEKLPYTQRPVLKDFIPPPHPKGEHGQPFVYEKSAFPSLGGDISSFENNLSANCDNKIIEKEFEPNISSHSDTNSNHEVEDEMILFTSVNEKAPSMSIEPSISNDMVNNSENLNCTSKSDNLPKQHPNTWLDKDISKFKSFEPGKPFLEPETINQPDNNQMFENITSDTSHINANNDSEGSLIEQLHDLYDHITTNWDSIPFRFYQREELKVLLKVVEHSQSLPDDVILVIFDRIKLLVNEAEKVRYNKQNMRKNQYYYPRNKR